MRANALLGLFLCFVFSLAIGQSLFADWPESLIHSPLRPTVSEVKLAMGSTEPPELAKIASYTDLAKAIASFEYAFPNGVYAFLGRDSALVADAFEAFYQAIGQNGRAIRLNASSYSFLGAGNEVIADFLETSGLDFNHPFNRPFIMADTTSFSDRSQSRMLIKAAYHRLVQRGFNPKDLLHKVNFVSFTTGYVIANMHTYFVAQKDSASPKGPSSTLRIPPGISTYSQPWHSEFHPFKKTELGTIAPPGISADENLRRGILDELWIVMGTVSSPEFIQMVQAEAHRLGFQFSLKESLFSILFKESEGDLLKTLKKLKKENLLDEATKDRIFPSGNYADSYISLIPALVQDGFSIEELHKLGKILVWEPEKYSHFLEALLPHVKNVDEFFLTSNPLSNYIANEYRLELDHFLIKNFKFFIMLGATLQDVISLESRYFSTHQNRVALWYLATEAFQNPKDQLTLFQMVQKEPNDKYRLEKDKFITQTFSKWIENKDYRWNIDDVQLVLNLVHDEITALKILEIAIPNFTTLKEFDILFNEYLVQNHKWGGSGLKTLVPLAEQQIVAREIYGDGFEEFLHKYSKYSRFNYILLESKNRNAKDFFVNLEILRKLNLPTEFSGDDLKEIFISFSAKTPNLEQREKFIAEMIGLEKSNENIKMKFLISHVIWLNRVESGFPMKSWISNIDEILCWFSPRITRAVNGFDYHYLEELASFFATTYPMTVKQANQFFGVMGANRQGKYMKRIFVQEVLPHITDPENLSELDTNYLPLSVRLKILNLKLNTQRKSLKRKFIKCVTYLDIF